MSKKIAIANLISNLYVGLGLDQIDNTVECELETEFDALWTNGGRRLGDPKKDLAYVRQYQDITVDDVANHPEFKRMTQQMARNIAKGAWKQSLQFQLEVAEKMDEDE